MLIERNFQRTKLYFIWIMYAKHHKGLEFHWYMRHNQHGGHDVTVVDNLKIDVHL